MNWLPPLPPLPVMETLVSCAVLPNEFIPGAGISTSRKQWWRYIPFKIDGTLKPMPPIGTLPIVVFAVTFAVPCKVTSACAVSVTSWNNVCIAPSFNDWNGMLWKAIGKSASFPVDTPPTVLDVGKFN
jgi:hypothetical protein